MDDFAVLYHQQLVFNQGSVEMMHTDYLVTLIFSFLTNAQLSIIQCNNVKLPWGPQKDFKMSNSVLNEYE